MNRIERRGVWKTEREKIKKKERGNRRKEADMRGENGKERNKDRRKKGGGGGSRGETEGQQ